MARRLRLALIALGGLVLLALLALVRWHHVGSRKETRLGITAAGLEAMRALLTAGG